MRGASQEQLTSSDFKVANQKQILIANGPRRLPRTWPAGKDYDVTYHPFYKLNLQQAWGQRC